MNFKYLFLRKCSKKVNTISNSKKKTLFLYMNLFSTLALRHLKLKGVECSLTDHHWPIIMSTPMPPLHSQTPKVHLESKTDKYVRNMGEDAGVKQQQKKVNSCLCRETKKKLNIDFELTTPHHHFAFEILSMMCHRLKNKHEVKCRLRCEIQSTTIYRNNNRQLSFVWLYQNLILLLWGYGTFSSFSSLRFRGIFKFI